MTVVGYDQSFQSAAFTFEVEIYYCLLPPIFSFSTLTYSVGDTTLM
jgi:hypothetical protein